MQDRQARDLYAVWCLSFRPQQVMTELECFSNRGGPKGLVLAGVFLLNISFG